MSKSKDQPEPAFQVLQEVIRRSEETEGAKAPLVLTGPSPEERLRRARASAVKAHAARVESLAVVRSSQP